MNEHKSIPRPQPLVLADHRTADGKVETGQCDCNGACAATLEAVLGDPGGKGLWSLPFDSNSGDVFEVALNDDFSAVHSSRASDGPSVLNRPALRMWKFFSQPTSLGSVPPSWYQRWGRETTANVLVRMISAGLLVPESACPTLTEQPQTLAAWLHVTDRCNLRCVYCYRPHVPADMSIRVGRAVVAATVRSAVRHGYGEVKLKYAGGESLLLFPRIAELHRYAADLTRQHGLGLTSLVLSNGTLLTAEMIETMLELGICLAISVDGVGSYHDCHRRYPDGNGSFDDVAQAVELAVSHGLTPYITVTISSRNVDGLPELMAWVLERDLPFSLNFYRENDLSASQVDLQLEEQRIVEGMLAAYEVVEANLPRRSLLASLADRANLSVPHLRACSVGHSYLVFDQLGRVAKCQMDMGCAVTDISDPDPLATVRGSAVGIRNPKVDEKAECGDCLWRYWCAGGCPLMAYRVTGHYDARSPNCGIYEVLLPEVIRLEGLRLLKYAGELEEHPDVSSAAVRPFGENTSG